MLTKRRIATGAIVCAVALFAAGAFAYSSVLKYGYATVHLPDGGLHRHWVVGQQPIADDYLARRQWSCVGHHNSIENKMSLRCEKAGHIRSIATACDGQGFLHIEDDQVEIETGCVIERSMD